MEEAPIGYRFDAVSDSEASDADALLWRDHRPRRDAVRDPRLAVTHEAHEVHEVPTMPAHKHKAPAMQPAFAASRNYPAKVAVDVDVMEPARDAQPQPQAQAKVEAVAPVAPYVAVDMLGGEDEKDVEDDADLKAVLGLIDNDGEEVRFQEVADALDEEEEQQPSENQLLLGGVGGDRGPNLPALKHARSAGSRSGGSRKKSNRKPGLSRAKTSMPATRAKKEFAFDPNPHSPERRFEPQPNKQPTRPAIKKKHSKQGRQQVTRPDPDSIPWGTEVSQGNCCADCVHVTFCCCGRDPPGEPGRAAFGANFHGVNIFAVWIWGTLIAYLAEMVYVLISYKMRTWENEDWAVTTYYGIVLGLLSVLLLVLCCVRSQPRANRGILYTVLLTCLSTLPAGVAGVFWEVNVKLPVPLDVHEHDARAGWLVLCVAPLFWPILCCSLLFVVMLWGSFIQFINPPKPASKLKSSSTKNVTFADVEGRTWPVQ